MQQHRTPPMGVLPIVSIQAEAARLTDELHALGHLIPDTARVFGVPVVLNPASREAR